MCWTMYIDESWQRLLNRIAIAVRIAQMADKYRFLNKCFIDRMTLLVVAPNSNCI